MRRTLRYLAILALLFFCAAGGVSWWAYEAVQDVRPFYREAMAVKPELLQRAGKELSSRATAIINDAEQGEPWRAQFTVDQINGWLAYDLLEKHADLLPEDVADPRVALDEGQIQLGVRYTGGRVETVLSVDVRPYLAEANVLGLRILGANAGTLPIPIGEVTDRITRAAERFDIPLTWIQEAQTPTALVMLNLKSARNGQRLQWDTLEVSRGAILLGGTTECEESVDAADAGRPDQDTREVEPQRGPLIPNIREHSNSFNRPPPQR